MTNTEAWDWKREYFDQIGRRLYHEWGTVNMPIGVSINVSPVTHLIDGVEQAGRWVNVIGKDGFRLPMGSDWWVCLVNPTVEDR